MGVMVYALVIYQFRAKAIRTRSGAPYDDRLGPVSLPLLLVGSFDLVLIPSNTFRRRYCASAC
jgi:hypothetical protein